MYNQSLYPSNIEILSIVGKFRGESRNFMTEDECTVEVGGSGAAMKPPVDSGQRPGGSTGDR
jgi:hypothetical protein